MNATIDRKRILIFVAIAYGLSMALYLANSLYGNPLSLRMVRVLCMFAPTIAHVATRLITREGWSNTFLRPDLRGGRGRYYLAAWFLPFVATAVGGAVYYLLFPGHFDPSMTAYRGLGGTNSLGSGLVPWMYLIVQVGAAIVAPWSEALLLSFGEEFGWRAYLLPKLMPLGPRKAALLVGAIWGAWHWPSIWMGSDYGLGYWGAPVVGPLLFVVTTCFESPFYAWVTLRSGSVWPAALAHGAINAANNRVWILSSGLLNPLLGPGTQGIVGSLGYAVLALLILISPRALAQPEPAPAATAVAGTPVAAEKTAERAGLASTR